MGETVTKSLNGKIAANYQIDKRFMFLKTFLPHGAGFSVPGHAHVYDRYFETYFSIAAWPIKLKVLAASLGRGT